MTYHPVRCDISTLRVTKSGAKRHHKWCPEIFARLAHRSYPARTAWYLAEISDISEYTVRKHLTGQKPNVDHAFAYMTAGEFGQTLRRHFLPKGLDSRSVDADHTQLNHNYSHSDPS